MLLSKKMLGRHWSYDFSQMVEVDAGYLYTTKPEAEGRNLFDQSFTEVGILNGAAPYTLDLGGHSLPTYVAYHADDTPYNGGPKKWVLNSPSLYVDRGVKKLIDLSRWMGTLSDIERHTGRQVSIHNFRPTIAPMIFTGGQLAPGEYSEYFSTGEGDSVWVVFRAGDTYDSCYFQIRFDESHRFSTIYSLGGIALTLGLLEDEGTGASTALLEQDLKVQFVTEATEELLKEVIVPFNSLGTSSLLINFTEEERSNLIESNAKILLKFPPTSFFTLRELSVRAYARRKELVYLSNFREHRTLQEAGWGVSLNSKIEGMELNTYSSVPYTNADSWASIVAKTSPYHTASPPEHSTVIAYASTAPGSQAHHLCLDKPLVMGGLPGSVLLNYSIDIYRPSPGTLAPASINQVTGFTAFITDKPISDPTHTVLETRTNSDNLGINNGANLIGVGLPSVDNVAICLGKVMVQEIGIPPGHEEVYLSLVAETPLVEYITQLNKPVASRKALSLNQVEVTKGAYPSRVQYVGGYTSIPNENLSYNYFIANTPGLKTAYFPAHASYVKVTMVGGGAGSGYVFKAATGSRAGDLAAYPLSYETEISPPKSGEPSFFGGVTARGGEASEAGEARVREAYLRLKTLMTTTPELTSLVQPVYLHNICRGYGSYFMNYGYAAGTVFSVISSNINRSRTNVSLATNYELAAVGHGAGGPPATCTSVVGDVPPGFSALPGEAGELKSFYVKIDPSKGYLYNVGVGGVGATSSRNGYKLPSYGGGIGGVLCFEYGTAFENPVNRINTTEISLADGFKFLDIDLSDNPTNDRYDILIIRPGFPGIQGGSSTSTTGTTPKSLGGEIALQVTLKDLTPIVYVSSEESNHPDSLDLTVSSNAQAKHGYVGTNVRVETGSYAGIGVAREYTGLQPYGALGQSGGYLTPAKREDRGLPGTMYGGGGGAGARSVAGVFRGGKDLGYVLIPKEDAADIKSIDWVYVGRPGGYGANITNLLGVSSSAVGVLGAVVIRDYHPEIIDLT